MGRILHGCGIIAARFFLIFLACIVVLDSAFASYCAVESQSSSLQAKTAKIRSHSTSIDLGGERFNVLKPRAGSMIEIRDGKDKIVSRVNAIQYEFGGIRSVDVMPGYWLWIDGDEIDYVARLIYRNERVEIENITPLPRLFEEPCYSISDFFGDCLKLAGGELSTALQRVFVSGFPSSIFGTKNRVGYEIVSGNIRLLPPPIDGARYILDLVDGVKGSLFKIDSGGLWFYDGSKVSEILNAQNQAKAKNWYFSITSPSGRVVLTNMSNLESGELFLAEVIGSKLVNFSVTGKSQRKFVTFLDLPDGSLAWVGQDGVYVEKEKKFSPVLQFSQKFAVLDVELDERQRPVVPIKHGQTGRVYYISIEVSENNPRCLKSFDPAL